MLLAAGRMVRWNIRDLSVTPEQVVGLPVDVERIELFLSLEYVKSPPDVFVRLGEERGKK
jgi:hypothetical protein